MACSNENNNNESAQRNVNTAKMKKWVTLNLKQNLVNYRKVGYDVQTQEADVCYAVQYIHNKTKVFTINPNIKSITRKRRKCKENENAITMNLKWQEFLHYGVLCLNMLLDPLENLNGTYTETYK